MYICTPIEMLEAPSFVPKKKEMLEAYHIAHYTDSQIFNQIFDLSHLLAHIRN